MVELSKPLGRESIGGPRDMMRVPWLLYFAMLLGMGIITIIMAIND